MNKISDNFLIGDLHSAALVSKGASINWLCLPHFDSPSIFAKLLGNEAGEFSIMIDGKRCSSETEYVKDTAIVKTIFRKKNSEVNVKDFMVPQQRNKADSHILVRKIYSVKGNHKINIIFSPKTNYGDSFPKIKQNKEILSFDLHKSHSNTGKRIFLHIPKNSEVEFSGEKCIISFELNEKEMKEVVLENAIKKGDHKHKDLEKKTRTFWNRWIKKGNFFEFCKEELKRSAITLKLMQFYSTGAIIAAPTTSLPESIEGNRNWDYRYVWIRDATFTLYALYVLGYTNEAKRFFSFIEKISQKFKKESDLDLIYTIKGKKPEKEKNLDHLSGYKNSKPVRIGNNAIDQFQLDTYGILIDSYYFMLNKGFRISKRKRKIIMYLVDQIEKRWKEKDSGIWEFRENIKDYTYSKVTAWLGINRAVRISHNLSLPKERQKELIKLEEEIKYWIWENCYDVKSNKLLRYPGSKHQDSTNFLFVLMQFLNKKDPITKKIIENSIKELVYKKVFVYRYKEDDEFEGKEGAFILCTFWMISALAIMEKVNEAEKIFHQFEKYICKNKLMSEEINPKNKEYLGNFPQGFSHMGYIMSAYYIDKYKRKVREKNSK